MEPTSADATIRHFVQVRFLPPVAGAAFVTLLTVNESGDPGRAWHAGSRYGATLWLGLAALAVSLHFARPGVERLLQGAVVGAGLRRVGLGELRAAVRSGPEAVERAYGFDAAFAWPRLEVLVDDLVRGRIRLWRLRYETGVATAAVGVLVLGASLAAVIVESRSVLLLLIPLIAALWGYRVAVLAAHQHGAAVLVAFDLYRFDLLTALRLPLPATRAAEIEANRKLTALWTAQAPGELVYRHRGVDIDVLDRVEDAVKGVLVPSAPIAFRGVVEVALHGAEPVPGVGNRQWQIPVGVSHRLAVTLVIGTDDPGAAARSDGPADWRNPDALATEFVDVRGRPAPRVEIEVEIDAPFVDVVTARHYYDLATDEDVAVCTTEISVDRPGRFDLLVAVYSSGRLVQAVPIELTAVDP